MREVLKFGLILMFTCLISGGLLARVYQFTEPKRVQIEEERREESLKDVLPQAVSFEERKEYYIGYSPEGEIVGYSFLTEGKGYSSIIKTMVGINLKGEITGIKILYQNETPGLGARIVEVPKVKTIWKVLADILRGEGVKPLEAKPWFQEQFKGKVAEELEILPGKIEGITGATISSRAVTESIRERIKEALKLIKEDEP